MAGIITDFKSDIQRLNDLKKAIADVKNELKSINIKVDIDIAKGLEAQLKSLTNQYHGIVDKIAQAEAKILLSVKKINDASEKIIQAQEKVSKFTNTPTQTGNANTQVNSAEIANIQAQAKAYEDLKTEINDILGTRDANVKRMVEEMNAIRLINAEIKKINKLQGESGTLSSAQQKRLEQLNNSLLTHKTALSEVRQNLSNNVRMDNAAATSMNGLSQSLSRMRIAYRELTEEERNSPFGKELLASINQADDKIKELDATIGNHQRNVGNYGKQWNGLSMSIQQVGRELPSLAYGPKVFFSAISNNLPILADEIKRARNEYELLKKSGQSATPVWKQITTSLFSWQSALTVGITLLTLYGDKMVDWVAGLFKAKDATLELLSAENEMGLSRRKAAESIKKEQTELNILYSKLRNATISAKERIAATNEWVKRYPEYANILSSENINLGKLESAYKALSKEIYANAVARHYADKIGELSVKKEKEEIKRLNQKLTVAKAEQELERLTAEYDKKKEKGFGTATAKIEARDKVEKARSNVETQKKIYNDLVENVKQYGKNIETIEQHIKTSDLFPQPEKGTYDYWTQQVQIADTALKQIKDSYLKVLQSGDKEKIKLIPDDVVKRYDTFTKQKAEAEKALKVYDSTTKQENQAEKLRKQQEKSSEQLLSLRRKNQQDEISLMQDGTEKKLKQIAADFEAQKQEVEKKAKELAKTNKEAGITDVNKNGLTFVQQSELDKANKLNADSRKKAEADLYKAEAEVMRNYLKEYGTFHQQKLAIAEEYTEKIRKAQNEGERLSLEKQKNTALQQVEVNAIKQSVDWGSVFGEFGSMFKEQLQPTIDKLKTISQSDEFKSSSLQDQQTLYELIAKLEQSNASWDSDIFKKVSDDMVAYQAAMQNYINAQEREKQATEALAQAKRDLEKVEKSGNGKDALNAQAKVTEAQFVLSAASDDVKNFGSQVQQTTSDLQSSSAQAVNMFQNLESGLKGLTSGSLQGIGQGIMQLDKLFNKGELTKDAGNVLAKGFQSLLGEGSKASKAITEALGSAGMTGEIISAMLGILDMLKDGFSGIIISLQDTVFNAIEGILDDAFSGDIIVKPIQNALSHVGNILDTVTFGGFSSWFGIGGNGKEVEETTERLTNSNERLKDAVDNLKDEMSKSGGWKAIDSAKQAKADQETINKQTSQILMEQMGYHGSHHSNAYYWGLGRNDYSSLNKTLSDYLKKNPNADVEKNSVYSLEDVYKLTPEQMDYIRTYNIEMWEKMLDQGKYDKSEYWENYADLAGELEEITDALKETLTQTSFDTLRDSFVESLMDMDKSAEDFADDFQQYMMKAILNSKISDLLDADIQSFYDKWAKYQESGNNLEDWELDDLTKDWDDLVEKGIDIRKQIADFTGYTGDTESTSQSSTTRGYETMSQDTGEELSGRLTAVYEGELRLENQAIAQTGLLSSINDKISLLDLTNEDIPRLTANIPDIAGQTRESITSGYQPQVNVIFPDAKIDILTAEVSTLKGIVNEMRTLQVDGNLDRQEIREGVQVIAKNNPKVLANTDEIKRDIKNAI